jgi:uncharacterized membrane protein
MSTNEPPPPEQPPGGYGAPPPPPPAPAQGGGGYSAGTAWSYGWNKFTSNLGQILLAVIVLVVVQIAVQAISYLVSDALLVRWVFSLAAWVLSMIIGAGIVRFALDITEGKRLDAATILTPNKLGDVIIVSLVTGVLTFIGLILCVLPGLAVMFFTSFSLYFLMDREDLGAIDAIKASFEFTKNNAGSVIVWFLLGLATWIVGALLCGVGLIAAIPVVLIGTAYTYKTLNGQPVAA